MGAGGGGGGFHLPLPSPGWSPALQESGPLESEAMVLGVLSQAFDVLVLRYGVQKRVYCNVSMRGAQAGVRGLRAGRGRLPGADGGPCALPLPGQTAA